MFVEALKKLGQELEPKHQIITSIRKEEGEKHVGEYYAHIDLPTGTYAKAKKTKAVGEFLKKLKREYVDYIKNASSEKCEILHGPCLYVYVTGYAHTKKEVAALLKHQKELLKKSN